MRRAAGAAAVTLVAALGACSDANGPTDGEVRGRYVLATVNGAPLPFVVHAGLLGPTRVLVAGSLATQGGQLVDVRRFHLGPVTANAPTETDSATYAFTQQRNLLLVQRPRVNPALSHVDSGQVSGDEIVLHVRYVAPNEFAPTRGTLLYRRER